MFNNNLNDNNKEIFELKLQIFYLQEEINNKLYNIYYNHFYLYSNINDKNLINQLVELKTKIDEQNNEIESRNTLLIKARNAIENMQVYFIIIQGDISIANTEILTLTNQKNGLIKTLSTLQKTLENTENENIQLKERYDNMEIQYNDNINRFHETFQRNEILEKENYNFANSFADYQSKIAELQSQLDSLTKYLQERNDNIEKLEYDLNEEKQGHNDLKKKYAEIVDRNNQLFHENNEIKNNNNNLIETNKNLENENNNIKKTYEEVKTNYENTTKDLNKLSEEHSELKQNFNNIKELNENLENNNKKLDTKIQELSVL